MFTLFYYNRVFPILSLKLTGNNWGEVETDRVIILNSSVIIHLSTKFITSFRVILCRIWQSMSNDIERFMNKTNLNKSIFYNCNKCFWLGLLLWQQPLFVLAWLFNALDNTKQIGVGVGIGFLPCKTQLNFITTMAIIKQ